MVSLNFKIAGCSLLNTTLQTALCDSKLKVLSYNGCCGLSEEWHITNVRWLYW